ncbi:MAG: dTDP-4-dehydrorhamnose reductase [Solirubrobacteraceae bacterium]
MRLLVTGAGGQLGRDVVRAARRAGHDVTGCDRHQLDITDQDAVARALEAHRPEAVVNCAAYTDVDGAEAAPDTAMEVNAVAAGRVAAAAGRASALVVHVSTDYVFDGRRRRPYLESDEARPLSAYGRSKLAGEHAVAEANPGHTIVRSSWLFGASGPNFVETMLTLASERDEVAVVTDQVGCPTWTGHLAAALVEICVRRSLGLHHVAADGQCSWHAFAREIFRQAGVECAVRERRTADLGRPARRPAYSVLRSERADAPRLAHWGDGLSGYLAERAATPGADPGSPT